MTAVAAFLGAVIKLESDNDLTAVLVSEVANSLMAEAAQSTKH
jgi:hypothetical protein